MSSSNGTNGKVYRVEDVTVKGHERSTGNGTAQVRPHSSKRVKVVETIPAGRRDGLLLGIAQDAGGDTEPAERLASPYRPELFQDSMDGVYLPHALRAVYARRVTQDDVDAAVREGIPVELEGYAMVLSGKRDLSPEEIEQFMFVSRVADPVLLGEYARRGYSLDEAEVLAAHGGEPPELSGADAELWGDKWVAWEDKHRTVRFADMSFTGGACGYPIDDTEFAVLDFETTGADIDEGDRIIEVGVTVVNSRGEVLGRVDSLVHPGDGMGLIGQYGYVHKISDVDVADAPGFGDVYPDLADALSGRVVVAQNKKFEEVFLSSEVARVTVERLNVPSLCTVDLATRFVGDKVENKKLGTMANHFGVELGDRAHEAIADTNATAQMLVGYLDHLKANGVDTLYAAVPPADFPRRDKPGRQQPRTRVGG
jgi:DNA polymerase III epsilon subunit-like protein